MKDAYPSSLLWSFEGKTPTKINIIKLSKSKWNDDWRCPDSSSLWEISVLMSSTSPFKSILLWWLSQCKVPQRRHTSQHKGVFRSMSLLRSRTKIQVGCQTTGRCQEWRGMTIPVWGGEFHCQKESRIMWMGRRAQANWLWHFKKADLGLTKTWSCPMLLGRKENRDTTKLSGAGRRKKRIFSATDQEFVMIPAFSFHKGNFLESWCGRSIPNCQRERRTKGNGIPHELMRTLTNSVSFIKVHKKYTKKDNNDISSICPNESMLSIIFPCWKIFSDFIF